MINEQTTSQTKPDIGLNEAPHGSVQDKPATGVSLANLLRRRSREADSDVALQLRFHPARRTVAEYCISPLK